MNGIKTISSDRSNLHEIASKQFLKNFRWLFFTINLYILSKVLSCMFPLFNLQGTRPRYPVLDFLGLRIQRNFILPRVFRFVKNFFCSFFNRFLSKPPCDQRSVILADHSFLVKHFLQILFLSFSFLLCRYFFLQIISESDTIRLLYT